ncbi:MAG TPA: hypothetical protein VNM35_08420, partial [Chitinophagaceae bacterium]|nr:hypothetical protein [Chitinophagaceae bacterium]
MIYKYFLLFLFLAYSSLACFTVKKVKQREPDIEGYIILDIKTFNDVDGSGIYPKTLRENDSIMLSS